MANGGISGDITSGSAAKRTGASAGLTAPGGDISNISGAKISHKDSVVLRQSELPEAFLAWKASHDKTMTTMWIGSALFTAVMASAIVFTPVTTILLLGGATIFTGTGYVTGTTADRAFNKLTKDIAKLSPQDRKEAILQINKVNPRLAARIEHSLKITYISSGK